MCARMIIALVAESTSAVRQELHVHNRASVLYSAPTTGNGDWKR